MSTAFAVVLAVTMLCITFAVIAVSAIRGWVETIRIREGHGKREGR